mmetsp:Transcript_227/g.1781  ORF Transcript_227/g.1781 Transcript_227/m.1781 type:complete len:387 (-) Transcript_227:27-1187(-)
MKTSETALVSFSICEDMLHMLLPELLTVLLDNIPTSSLAGSCSAEVGVATSAVPITWDGLRIERSDNIVELCDAKHEISAHPQMVTHFDAQAWSNLVFPLSRHNFCIDAANFHASIEASLVVGLDDVAPNRNACSSAAVIRSLRTREPVFGPAQWPLCLAVKECVFLLNSKPDDLILVLFHGQSTGMPGIGWEGLHMVSYVIAQHVTRFGRHIHIAHDQHIVSLAERVFKDGSWYHEHFTVVPGRLSRGRSIVVPNGKVFRTCWWTVQRLGLASDVPSTSSQPDIFCQNLTIWIQVTELVQDGVVQQRLGHVGSSCGNFRVSGCCQATFVTLSSPEPRRWLGEAPPTRNWQCSGRATSVVLPSTKVEWQRSMLLRCTRTCNVRRLQ